MNKDVVILAVETSCDETACAVVKNGREVLSNIISSQIDIHALYGGVVPEIASRAHLENIIPVIDEALKEAQCRLEGLDAIGVTYGPGLVGALLVGVAAAKSLALAKGLPLVGVDHMKGHICANYLNNRDTEPPFLCLLVSGGHTELVMVRSYTDYEALATTRDDSVGEVFDKVARIIGLGYPGGPKVDRLAQKGNAEAFAFPKTTFVDNLDFSFSGLKTAVINRVHRMEQRSEPLVASDVAASFQRVAVEALCEHTEAAVLRYKPRKLVLAGGVAANSRLRAEFDKLSAKLNLAVAYPDLAWCTDNAAMIGSAAYYDYRSGVRSPLSLNAVPYLEFDS